MITKGIVFKRIFPEIERYEEELVGTHGRRMLPESCLDSPGNIACVEASHGVMAIIVVIDARLQWPSCSTGPEDFRGIHSATRSGPTSKGGTKVFGSLERITIPVHIQTTIDSAMCQQQNGGKFFICQAFVSGWELFLTFQRSRYCGKRLRKGSGQRDSFFILLNIET